MQLPGRLSATTLGDVLGTLYRGRATGVLELVECAPSAVGRRHRLHLRAGLVGQVETPLRVPRIGEILRQEGFLRVEAARRLVRGLVREPGKRAGQLLVAERLATVGQVAAALRHQLILRLEAVFTIREAHLRFHVAGSRLHQAAVTVPLSPHEFLHGRSRTRDQPGRNGAPAQRAGGSNPRSTVATTTEIYDYLRLLFARVGEPHCWVCGREIASQHSSKIVDWLLAKPAGTKIQICHR